MKIKKGTFLESIKFKKWLFQKLQTEVCIDTDEYPNFPGKEKFIANLLSRGNIVPALTDDERNQEILEATRQANKNKWLRRLEDQKKANETIQDKMIKAELRVKKQNEF